MLKNKKRLIIFASFLLFVFGVFLFMSTSVGDKVTLLKAKNIINKNFDYSSGGYIAEAMSLCKDDEIYIRCNPPYQITEPCNGTNDVACCSSSLMCVANSTCYPLESWVDTADDSIDEEWCVQEIYGDPNTSAWYDQDLDKNICQYTWFSSSSYCKDAGPGGICDDADGGAFCCGDDRMEYPKQGRDGSKACCNSNSKVVVNGKCYAAKNKAPKIR